MIFESFKSNAMVCIVLILNAYADTELQYIMVRAHVLSSFLLDVNKTLPLSLSLMGPKGC